jgi:CcmD family protein
VALRGIFGAGWGIAALVGVWLCSPSSVWAQQPRTADEAAQEKGSGESRAAAFRAVEGSQQEEIPGGPLLIGAYGLAWLLLLVFVVRIGRMQSSTAREIERLERSLGAAGQSGEAPPARGD